MSKEVEIGNRSIGREHPVFVIAEIGVNHNGDLDLAKKMIDAAHDAGVDSVKFQAFRAEDFVGDKTLMHEYQQGGQTVRENMFEMFERLELGESGHRELFDYARKKGLIPLTSVADELSAEMIERIGVEAYKIGSCDIIHLEMIRQICEFNKPILVSTGMADQGEIQDVLEIFREKKFFQSIFLHCVSIYPTPDEIVNLNRMKALETMTNGAVGFSDHTFGNEAALGAVALGAVVIEKHFTLDRGLPGPDQSLSSEPDEFKTMIDSIRRLEKMRGAADLEPSEQEKQLRALYRCSLVAARDLPRETSLKKGDLALKRPGDGIKPRELSAVLGRKLNRSLEKDQPLRAEFLTD